MRALGYGESPQDAEKHFRAADTDGSGVIEFEEFRTMMAERIVQVLARDSDCRRS